MSATSPTSPIDLLGLDAPFAEGADEAEPYDARFSWNELGESPYAEATESPGQEASEQWRMDPDSQQLAWLDLEAADGGAEAFAAEDPAPYGEALHEHDHLHEDEAEQASLRDDTARESEYLDDEERDASESYENDILQEGSEPEAEAATTGVATPLTAQQRAWVLALDRSAIERLPDAAMRTRFLQQDWSDVEFPGNVPRGQSATADIKRHWGLARSLFNAMAGPTPERRVPTMIRFRDRPVAKVPGQPSQRLYAEARDAFVRMRAAAKADGIDLVILSSWRSRARQAAASANQPNPAAVARKASAHMYGLAIDLRMGVPGLPVKEINTRVDRATAAAAGTAAKMGNLVRMYRSPVYKWMSLRAREFGWYPYRNEPWHWEYNPPGLKARFEGGTRGELEHEAQGEWTEASWEHGNEASAYTGAEYEDEAAATPFLRTFTAKALNMKVAVYVTQAACSARQVEMMVFAHGLDLCKPVLKNRPATFITEAPFRLGQLVEACGRPIVLVVPFLEWERLAANDMAFGRKWHRFARPETFNRVAAEALEQARAISGRASVQTVQRLILAGHSRAYGFFDALAHEHASPQQRTGALSRPTHVWALDTTYSAPIADWRAWLRSRPDLQATVVFRHGKYRAKGAATVRELTTGIRGREFMKLAAVSDGKLTVVPVAAGKVSHCAVPTAYLPRLLAALPPVATVNEHEAEAQDQEFEEAEDYAGLATEAEAWAMEDETSGEQWSESPANEEDFETSGRFDAFGDERDSEWGAESSEEAPWQEDSFEETEHGLSFALEHEEETGLAGSGLTPAEQKAVEITSLFETGKRGGFYGLSGNFDGQGLSFGLVNWTIGTGSLQPLLRDFAKEHPARWVQTFAADASRFLQLIARKDKNARQEQHRFAVEQMNLVSLGARGKRIWTVRQPWVGYFKRLSEDPAFRKIQVRYVRHLLVAAEGYCRQFRLTSEQAFCFMFDAVASHGKWWLRKKFGGVEKRRILVEQASKALAVRFGAGRVPESEVLLAIADALATTSAQRWADKVRRRKRWFVTGQHPRGRELTGLKPRADVPYTSSQATAGEAEFIGMDGSGESEDVIHRSSRSPAGGAGGGSAGAGLVTGDFEPFVGTGRVDRDIAHILNVMDGYPAGSWTKGCARFLLRELASGRLAVILKNSMVHIRIGLVPEEGRAVVADAARDVASGAFPAMTAEFGTTGSALILRDTLVRNGTQPGEGRKDAALKIAHEATHIRNRISMPPSNPTLPTGASFIDVGLAARLNGVHNRDHFMGELACNHVAWRVLKEIEHKWNGRPIPAQPSIAGLFSYALSLGNLGMVASSNAYLDDIRNRSHDAYAKQIGTWVRDTGVVADFTDDPLLNSTTKALFASTFAAFAPTFSPPPDPPDGAIISW